VRDRTVAGLHVVVMVAVIVAVDVLFFEGRFWLRLAANVGIILLFAIVYFRFIQRR
jgi:hypothetical protein